MMIKTKTDVQRSKKDIVFFTLLYILFTSKNLKFLIEITNFNILQKQNWSVKNKQEFRTRTFLILTKISQC